MNIPQIRIQQTYAQIGTERTPAKQEIQQPNAQLNMHQEPAQMQIERTPSRLEIDQTQAWNDLHLKDTYTLLKDTADKAKQLALEGIARRTQEGAQLAEIEKGGSPIAQIALSNANPGPIPFNIGVLPSYGAVKISFQPSEVQIDWQKGGVTLDPEIQKVVHEYTPGKVEIYLRQKAELNIDFVGGSLDQSV